MPPTRAQDIEEIEKLRELVFPTGGPLEHCRIKSAEVKGECSVNNRKGRTFPIPEPERMARKNSRRMLHEVSLYHMASINSLNNPHG